MNRIIKVEHRSKIECYPSFHIKVECKNTHQYIAAGVWLRIAAFKALGFEI